MILVVTMSNLLMFFAVRERQKVTYIAYIMSVGVYLSCTDGIAFQYLWPNHPEWNDRAYGVALFSVILWAMIFTKMFLHTSTRHPALDKIINAIIAVRAIIFLLAFFF